MKMSPEMIRAVLQAVDPSERSALDLRLSVWEGTAGRLSSIALHCRLVADTHNLNQPAPGLLVLCRDEFASPRLKVTELTVTNQDVARLVRLLRAAGFPSRVPRVVPNARSSIGGQTVALDVLLDGRDASLRLTLEYAGFSGTDAGPVKGVLLRLAELAAAGGRPLARAVVERLVRDRGDHGAAEPSRVDLALLAGDPGALADGGRSGGLTPMTHAGHDGPSPTTLPSFETKPRRLPTSFPAVGRWLRFSNHPTRCSSQRDQPPSNRENSHAGPEPKSE
jgi:hypothetical protein